MLSAVIQSQNEHLLHAPLGSDSKPNSNRLTFSSSVTPPLSPHVLFLLLSTGRLTEDFLLSCLIRSNTDRGTPSVLQAQDNVQMNSTPAD